MNQFIQAYFDTIEIYLLENPAICSYAIIRREITKFDGKLRTKATLNNNSLLEFFIYVNEIDGQVQLSKYSFHWQNAHGDLIKRWDNAPHHPTLENAPHHIHTADGAVASALNVPDVFSVMQQIENTSST